MGKAAWTSLSGHVDSDSLPPTADIAEKREHDNTLC